MVATRHNPAEDRIILGRFFRNPRIGPKYTYGRPRKLHLCDVCKAELKPQENGEHKKTHRSSLGCFIQWLRDCTISLSNPEGAYHSSKDFSEELGFASTGPSLRRITTLDEKSTDGEIFVQLSFWIEEIFGYKGDDGKWHGPIIKPDELSDMSNYDDPKSIKWMSVASRIQEHVKQSMHDRKLGVVMKGKDE